MRLSRISDLFAWIWVLLLNQEENFRISNKKQVTLVLHKIKAMEKTVFIIAFLLGASLFLHAQPKEVSVVPDISEVTVYRSGARIFAEKRLELNAGNQWVRFTGVSSELDNQSIQVAADGSVIILSVNHELDYLSGNEQSPALKNLLKLRDQLQKTVEKEKMQLDILEKEMQFMQVNMKVTGTNTTTKVAELAPVYDYFVSKITEITREKKWRSDSIQTWSDRINQINSQIGDLKTSQKTPAGVIVVNVDVPAKTTALFQLNYLIQNAAWYPVYDIRVKNIESPVMLTYKASLFQNSGLDWKDVKLRFSSANPSQTGILPELTPWFLNIQTPPKIRIRGYGVQQDQMMMKSAKVMETVREEQSPPPPPPPMMVTEESGTTVEFVMEKPYTILTNGKYMQVDISTVTVPALYSYLSVPKLDPSAQLKARLTNWEQLNLMPGEATIYFEGSFTGKTYLNTKDFSDTLDISLGVDRNIAVQRTLEKELSTTRLLASKTEAMKSWKLSIRNNKSQKISITVKDQLPISASSEIEVTETQISGGKLDSVTGEVTWQMDIKPAEKAEKKLSYTVRYPKGKLINQE
jgi:uncharacterized protein (TIGR02231 family)